MLQLPVRGFDPGTVRQSLHQLRAAGYSSTIPSCSVPAGLRLPWLAERRRPAFQWWFSCYRALPEIWDYSFYGIPMLVIFQSGALMTRQVLRLVGHSLSSLASQIAELCGCVS